MSKRYKPIETIDDIDLSKITLGNIEQRYIDAQGNRFATRFNIRTRKVQIVRIALGEDEARGAKGRLVEGLVKRRKPVHETEEQEQHHESWVSEAVGASGEHGHAHPAGTEATEVIPEVIEELKNFPDWVKERAIIPDESIIPEEFIRAIEADAKLYAERIFGVIGNLEKAGALVNRDGKDDVLILTNIYDLEINPLMQEVKQRIEEFVKYPRSPESYMNEVSASHHKYLDTLPANEQMDFLKPCLISLDYLPALEAMFKLNERAKEYADRYEPLEGEDAKNQAAADAKSTLETTEDSLTEQLEKFTGWLRKEKVY